MTTPPNILFLFPDQWRWDWLGCHGTVPVRTPHIDALAADGVRFAACRVNSPLCSPSRACLATLRHYDGCGVATNSVNTDPAEALLFRALRDAGYRVATCGKDDLHKGDQSWSRDGWMPILGRYGFTEALAHAGKWDATHKAKRGDTELYTSLLAQEGLLQHHLTTMDAQRREDGLPGGDTWSLPERLHTDAVCGANAISLIEQFPLGHPWALWVNFPGPHEPHDPPASFARRTAGLNYPDPIAMQGNAEDHQHLRRQYAANCEHLDVWVGRILDAIEQRGERENTLVVFASDHGDMMGDHGRYNKCVPFEGSLRVPCIVSGPGVMRRGTSQALVELIDLSATLVEMVGVGPTEHRDARSLWPLLRNECTDRQHRDYQHSGLFAMESERGWRCLTTATHKFVKTAAGNQLFDLLRDPNELHDVAEQYPDITKRLASLCEPFAVCANS